MTREATKRPRATPSWMMKSGKPATNALMGAVKSMTGSPRSPPAAYMTSALAVPTRARKPTKGWAAHERTQSGFDHRLDQRNRPRHSDDLRQGRHGRHLERPG